MLEYEMDISANSRTVLLTPDTMASSFPFWISEVGWFDAGERYFTRRDGKDSALLIVTQGGCGEITWKGQWCRLEPGSAVVIYCDSYHEYHTCAGGRWIFNWTHFSGTALLGYESILFRNLTPVMIESSDSAVKTFEHIEAVSANIDVRHLAEQSNCISKLLTEMVCSLAAKEVSGFSIGREDIRRLTEYINKNCEKALSINDFTDMTGLTKYHLIRTFTRQVGMPPYRYMNMCRINRAQRLLRATNKSVSEISYEIGYNDSIVFLRHFRKFTGVTPTVYRNESTALML